MNNVSTLLSKEASFTDRVESMKKKYKLQELFDQAYDDASKYGEKFIYIVPYKKALKKLLDQKEKANEVYDLIKDYKYILFAGRPMAGIGVDDAVSISNCFVVGKPGQDSYGTIAMIDQEIMQLSKRGGGVGTDLSDYRPGGSKVNNAAKTSSGPVEICATRFSNTIREVGQSGRRGALMLSMSVEHPSAEEFIDAKMENKDFDIPNKKGVYNIKFDMNMYGKYTVCLNYNVMSKDKYMLNKFDIVDKNGVRVSNEWIDITENDYPWLFAIYGPDGYYGVDDDEDDDD